MKSISACKARKSRSTSSATKIRSLGSIRSGAKVEILVGLRETLSGAFEEKLKRLRSYAQHRFERRKRGALYSDNPSPEPEDFGAAYADRITHEYTR